MLNYWKATAGKLGGVCRAKVFDLWSSGELGSVKVGRRRFSTDNQIAAFIGRLEANAASDAAAGVSA